MGESYIKLEIKGLPSDLFGQLSSFFQSEVRVRATKLYNLKEKLTEEIKKLYEVDKTYSTFNPLFVPETNRLVTGIQEVIDEAKSVIEQLEPAWRMTEAILTFQKEVFAHIQRAAQRKALDSLKGGYPSSFSTNREDNSHDGQPSEKEKPKEEKVEKKEEAEDGLFHLVSSQNGTPEPSERKSMLEEGTRLLGKGVSRLRESGWLLRVPGGGEGSQEKEGQDSENPSPTPATPSTPLQGRWGSLLGGYSPFKTLQQQDPQGDVSPVPERKEQKSEASHKLDAIARMNTEVERKL